MPIKTLAPDSTAPDNVVFSRAIASLTQALGGRAEVEIRPLENGFALILQPPAARSQDGPFLEQRPEQRPEHSDISRELTREARTAVTTILHALEMAAEASEGAERLPWGETVEKAARRLLHQVENLVELLPANRPRGHNVNFAPMALLRDVMDSAAGRAIERGVSLEAAVHGDLPDRVQGDATGLRRVMRLLLSHAVEESAGEADWALHFSDGGLGTATGAAMGAGLGAYGVRLEVGYQGSLSEELRHWLTQPLTSLGEAPAQYGEAAVSLGLARRLVEAEMGGHFSVTAEAAPAGRVRFACELQWLPGDVVVAEPTRAVRLNGSSVLAVTPDRSLRKVLQMRYAALGVRAMTVDSAAEALRLLEEAAPGAFDMVLVQYSRQEALVLGRQLASDARWNGLPRMTVSMAGEPGQAATAEEAGYQAYLTPPLPLDLMRDAFTVMLARAAAGADGELITRFSLAEAASARAKQGRE